LGSPWNSVTAVGSEKKTTGVMSPPEGDDMRIPLHKTPQCDGQTDGRTDGEEQRKNIAAMHDSEC